MDGFIELKYGKYKELDLHGKSIQDAYGELVHCINSLDLDYRAILVIHGYNLGTSLKNYIRNTFACSMVKDKVNIDAGRTLLVITNR